MDKLRQFFCKDTEIYVNSVMLKEMNILKVWCELIINEIHNVYCVEEWLIYERTYRGNKYFTLLLKQNKVYVKTKRPF